MYVWVLGRTGIALVPASLCGRVVCFVGAGWKFQTNDFVLFTAFLSPSLFSGWLQLQAKITSFAVGIWAPLDTLAPGLTDILRGMGHEKI